MKLFAKIFVIMLLPAAVFALEFALFGADFERLFSPEACREWFASMKAWGWLVGIALLLSDLVLPVPATGIMAALGNVYGFWAGVLFSIAGSAGAGVTGYALARFAGRRAIRGLASEEELHRFQRFFDQWGGIAIIGSRILPILPEVMTILAGLACMGWGRFLLSLLLGTVPTCMLFVWIGCQSRAVPVLGMAAAILLPLLIWPFFLKFLPRLENIPSASRHVD
ncbi:MAG: hypothetical protein BM485_04190 [Desulfobulbaceae bacterium DB1]|nr:MAG: hypothetical protein BM485_04190 [Desulfobulbaceae bacterium DB1]